MQEAIGQYGEVSAFGLLLFKGVHREFFHPFCTGFVDAEILEILRHCRTLLSSDSLKSGQYTLPFHHQSIVIIPLQHQTELSACLIIKFLGKPLITKEHTAGLSFLGNVALLSCQNMLFLQPDGFSNGTQLREEPSTTDSANPEVYLSVVLNTVGEGIIMFDQDNLIVLANREAEKMWGYLPGTLTGGYIHKLLEEAENAPPALINFLLNPSSTSEVIGKELEFVGYKQDKKKFPLAAKIQVTRIGNNLYYTAVLQDITERKMFLEQLMHAKNEAERSSKAKEEFLAHISHEIRTPLNAIFGLTELLLQMNPQGEQLAYTKALKYSSETLLLLINDVLDVAKIQAGKIQLQDYRFAMQDIFAYIQSTLQAQADEKRISLSYDIDSAVPGTLYGDAVRISQIVLNLVSNAVKFTDDGSVFYSVFVTDRTTAYCELMIEVVDTGIGIPEDKLQVIFDSFTQIKSTKYKTGKGSGLGLTISKSLARLFGGDISARSNQGRGVTFYCTLKVKTQAVPGKVYKSFRQFESTTADLSGVRILIAEDNELNRIVIRKMLDKSHAELTNAKNGVEVISLLEKNDYDVILMDISMPVLNGFEATERIRSEFPEPKRRIPIIALTAAAINSNTEDYIKSGMNDFLAKPFLMLDLYSKIIQHTGRGTLLQTATNQDGEDHTETPEALFDLQYLRETFGDNSVAIVSFLKKYLEQSRETLLQMRELAERMEYTELKRVAHKIKSGSRYIGANDFTEILERVEGGECERMSPTKVSELFTEISEKFRLLSTNLYQFISGLE